jgi:hypothetical protein
VATTIFHLADFSCILSIYQRIPLNSSKKTKYAYMEKGKLWLKRLLTPEKHVWPLLVTK